MRGRMRRRKKEKEVEVKPPPSLWVSHEKKREAPGQLFGRSHPDGKFKARLKTRHRQSQSLLLHCFTISLRPTFCFVYHLLGLAIVIVNQLSLRPRIRQALNPALGPSSTMAANTPDPTRILSIQSHVVSGYVGNRSATFPLQLLGWDVDVTNTVQFSNHTGYGRWGGLRFDDNHLSDIFANLDKNGLLRYSRMLTGYMPSAAVVKVVLELVKKLRRRQGGEEGGLVYLLDPVMGDMGRGMYVAQEVLPIYQEMLQYASIITPNQFEAQALTGIDITDLVSLKKVIWTFHKVHKVPHVIITSVELPDADLASIGAHRNLPDGRPAMLQVGSSCDIHLNANGDREEPSIAPEELDIWSIQFPEVQGYFSGVGDMFAALTLGRFRSEGEPSANGAKQSNGMRSTSPLTPIAKASELAIASLQGILANTCQVIEKLEKDQPESTGGKTDEAQERVDRMRRRELRVVQSKKEIESPTIVYHARWITK